MNKRNFKFYLSASHSYSLPSGLTIDNSGNTVQRDNSFVLLGPVPLIGEGIFVDAEVTDSYNTVYFYDNAGTEIGKTQLTINDVVLAPIGATSFAIRFTKADPAIAKAISDRPNTFVHNVYSIRPHYSKLEKKTEKVSGQEYFRDSLVGALKLVGDDFNLVSSQGLSTSFGVFIHLNGTKYYAGQFTKTECKLDYARRVCEPKISTKDQYARILDLYDDKYDLVKLKIGTTPVTCSKRPFIQIYALGASSVTNVFNGQSWEHEVSATMEKDYDAEKYGFEYIDYFREIYVEEAELPEVNGIYHEYVQQTEHSDIETLITYHRWYKTTMGVRTHYIELAWSYQNGPLYAYIKAVGNSSPLYYVANPDQIPTAMFNKKGSLKNLAFTSDYNGVFFITKDFAYDIYGRIIHNNEDKGIAISSNDPAISNISYKRISRLPANELIIRQAVDYSVKETVYGANDYGSYFTPEYLPATTGKYVPVSRSLWVNTSLWLECTELSAVALDIDYRVQYELRDSFSIGSVIKELLVAMGSSVTHEPTAHYSAFLYGSSSMILGLSKFYVFITQKTNAIKGVYDQAAQKAETSLKAIMDMLRDCFRCYWYIDNGRLIIEHISYFVNGLSYIGVSPSIDLTQINDGFNGKPILYGQGAVEYDTSELPRKYNFTYSDEGLFPFTDVSFETSAEYVQQDKVEDITINEFSADLDYMQISPDNVSKDGFALMCPIMQNGTYKVPILRMRLLDEGMEHNLNVQNGLASWAHLIELYAYDAPADNIKANVVPAFKAKGLKDCLLRNVRVPNISGVGPYSIINTDMGLARVLSVVENLDSGYMSLSLAYSLGLNIR